MKKILLINAHLRTKPSEGKLNKSLFDLSRNYLLQNECEVKTTETSIGYEIESELEKHIWADVVITQSPVFWFNMPWTQVKYIEEVFMFGAGKLFENDGRTQKDPLKQYGTGGLMHGKKYMPSLTYNAPREAFNNKDQHMFAGKSVDDTFFHNTASYKFCGYEILPAFVCFDVIKNPQFEQYSSELKLHLDKYVLQK